MQRVPFIPAEILALPTQTHSDHFALTTENSICVVSANEEHSMSTVDRSSDEVVSAESCKRLGRFQMTTGNDQKVND